MATKFAKVNSLTFPWLFPDQTPFFPDFNLTDFLTTHRFSLTLSTEFFFVMLPQAKILPCGDEYGTLKRIDVKVTTCKFPDFKNIFSNQCFFPDFAAFLCLFPWLFFTFLRQHVNSLTFPWIPWIPWFGGHPVERMASAHGSFIHTNFVHPKNIRLHTKFRCGFFHRRKCTPDFILEIFII